MEHVAKILSNPWNLLIFVTAVLLLVFIYIRTGRELKVGKVVLIPGPDSMPLRRV